MQMTNEEIRADYKNAKYPMAQVKILAQLNCCSESEINRILLEPFVTPEPKPAIKWKPETPAAEPPPPKKHGRKKGYKVVRKYPETPIDKPVIPQPQLHHEPDSIPEDELREMFNNEPQSIKEAIKEGYKTLGWPEPLICSEAFVFTVTPPSPLRPRVEWLQERYDEILDAISRYRQAGVRVPPEWLHEAYILCGDKELN